MGRNYDMSEAVLRRWGAVTESAREKKSRQEVSSLREVKKSKER